MRMRMRMRGDRVNENENERWPCKWEWEVTDRDENLKQITNQLSSSRDCIFQYPSRLVFVPKDLIRRWKDSNVL